VREHHRRHNALRLQPIRVSGRRGIAAGRIDSPKKLEFVALRDLRAGGQHKSEAAASRLPVTIDLARQDGNSDRNRRRIHVAVRVCTRQNPGSLADSPARIVTR